MNTFSFNNGNFNVKVNPLKKDFTVIMYKNKNNCEKLYYLKILFFIHYNILKHIFIKHYILYKIQLVSIILIKR